MLLDQDFELLPHYSATAEEKQEHAKIMRQGNTVLNQYLERVKAQIPRHNQQERAKAKLESRKPFLIQKYSRLQYRKDLFAAVKSGSTEVHGIVVSKADLAIILKVRAIEYTVICTYSHLIFKESKRWSATRHGSTLSFSDFYNEAVMAVENAVYGYLGCAKGEPIVFSTFAQTAIRHGILNAINQNKPMCPWPQLSKKLYGEFEATRGKLMKESGVEVTFEEIVEIMELNSDEISDLRAMLTQVVNHSELTANHDEDSSDTGIFGVAQDTMGGVDERMDVSGLVDVKMTDWERTVFDAWQADSSHGWATRIAEKHGYSRQAPKLALDRVLARIRQKYMECAAA